MRSIGFKTLGRLSRDLRGNLFQTSLLIAIILNFGIAAALFLASQTKAADFSFMVACALTLAGSIILFLGKRTGAVLVIEDNNRARLEQQNNLDDALLRAKELAENPSVHLVAAMNIEYHPFLNSVTHVSGSVLKSHADMDDQIIRKQIFHLFPSRLLLAEIAERARECSCTEYASHFSIDFIDRSENAYRALQRQLLQRAK